MRPAVVRGCVEKALVSETQPHVHERVGQRRAKILGIRSHPMLYTPPDCRRGAPRQVAKREQEQTGELIGIERKKVDGVWKRRGQRAHVESSVFAQRAKDVWGSDRKPVRWTRTSG